MIEKKRLIELGYHVSDCVEKIAIKYYGDDYGDFAVIFHESEENPGYYKDDKIPFMNLLAFRSTDTLKGFYAKLQKAVRAYKKDMKELFKGR